MTCDEAFDVLTSPAAPSSVSLHNHLRTCARCRDLQEALAPALQALSPEEPPAEEHPWSHGEHAARVAAGRLCQVSRSEARQTTERMWRWRFLLALIAGSGIVTSLAAWWPGDATPLSTVPASSPVCLWQTRDTSVFEGEPDSQAVIMTCVACHLDHRVSSAAVLP